MDKFTIESKNWTAEFHIPWNPNKVFKVEMEYIPCGKEYYTCKNTTYYLSTLRKSFKNDYVIMHMNYDHELYHQSVNDADVVRESSIIDNSNTLANLVHITTRALKEHFEDVESGNANKPIVLWSETVPQHFITPNGLWFQSCEPKITPTTFANVSIVSPGFMNEIVRSILANHSQITIVPIFAPLAAANWNIYEGKGREGDCCHLDLNGYLYLLLSWLVTLGKSPAPNGSRKTDNIIGSELTGDVGVLGHSLNISKYSMRSHDQFVIANAHCHWTVFKDPEMERYVREVQICAVRADDNMLRETESAVYGYDCLDEGIFEKFNISRPFLNANMSYKALQAKIKTFHGKKIAFIGDSVTRQTFIHFACMLNPHHSINFRSIRDHHYHRSIPVHAFDGKVIKSSSTSLELVSCSIHLDSCRFVYLFEHTLREALEHNDYVIVNMGLHHNLPNNSLVSGLEMTGLDQSIASFVVAALRIYNESHVSGKSKSILLWRESNPQTYDTPNGLYGFHASSCIHLHSDMFNNIALASPNFRNEIANSILEGTDIAVASIFIPLAAYTNTSYRIHNHHDCTHLNANSLFYIDTNIIRTLVAS